MLCFAVCGKLYTKTKTCYSKLLRFLLDVLVLGYLCIHPSVILSNWREDCVKPAVKSPPGGRRVAGGGGSREAVAPGGRVQETER